LLSTVADEPFVAIRAFSLSALADLYDRMVLLLMLQQNAG
jgi:hypothetical protein